MLRFGLQGLLASAISALNGLYRPCLAAMDTNKVCGSQHAGPAVDRSLSQSGRLSTLSSAELSLHCSVEALFNAKSQSASRARSGETAHPFNALSLLGAELSSSWAWRQVSGGEGV